MATPITVVLQKNVENLGQGGEVVRVRPGFARNYLFPRGLAVVASKSNLSRVDELKRAAANVAAKDLAEAQKMAASLEAISIRLERAVGEEDRMFGSVTTHDIAEAFAAAGVAVDRRRIVLGEPIKQLGQTLVPIKLHANVVANLRVEVVKKA